jgi:hypothetical protein
MKRSIHNRFRSFTLCALPALALLVVGVSLGQAQQRFKKTAPKPPQTVTKNPGAAVTSKHPLDLDLTAYLQPDGTVFLRGNIKYSPIVSDPKSILRESKSEFGKYSLHQLKGKDWVLIFDGTFQTDPYERVGVTSRGIRGSTQFKMSVVLKFNGRDHTREVEAAAR